MPGFPIPAQESMIKAVLERVLGVDADVAESLATRLAASAGGAQADVPGVVSIIADALGLEGASVLTASEAAVEIVAILAV